MTTEQKTEKNQQEKKAMSKVMDGELIEVKLELFSPYVDFLKDYLRYFGAKKTLEDLCREIIYDKTGQLYDDLHAFAEAKGHCLETTDWYLKHAHIACCSVEDEEEAVERMSEKKVTVMVDKETIEFAKKHGININDAVKQQLERLKAKFGN